jgi:CubicO group peptidase (beta-lactamase class C family)
VSLRIALGVVVAALAVWPVRATFERQASPHESRVDAMMSRWTTTTPGCAVGVSREGDKVLERGYGMADLEHDVPNKETTIFEAGSVSKQFTAAALLMLARDGKLSLDDAVRKYVPELPDYGAPLTIRHMLNHTSGLRDWGSVAAIAGWPRTSRVHTHGHVLDIISRQRTLNFTPGTRWSYSNSGYNLAAIIVSRVSGHPFAEFTRARIFEPLKMTRTSWRDDYTRVVKDRAIAYSLSREQFFMDMPFENVHGNGGLLTTVGDLLQWAANYSRPEVGDATFMKDMIEPGRFADGRPHDYGLGIRTRQHRGVRELWHSGSTAGYRAYLANYPDRRVSVAVLCNLASANADQFAQSIADVYLDLPQASTTEPPSAGAPADTNGARDSIPGMYRRTDTGEPIVIARQGGAVQLAPNVLLSPRSATQFVRSNGVVYDFVTPQRLTVTDTYGSVSSYERVSPSDMVFKPLTHYAGAYSSDEAETDVVVEADGDALVIRQRPDTSMRMTPVYADGFTNARLGFVRFHRDARGRVTSFSVTQDRVWDLRFNRQADARNQSRGGRR